MPLVLTFDGVTPGSHTWYRDLDTGAIVSAYLGDVVPVRMVDNPTYYVTIGLATISGQEDGSDGKLDQVTDGIRAVLVDVDPLAGDPSGWTLPDMLTRIASIQANDEAALDAYTELHRAPTVLSIAPANGAEDVDVDTSVVVMFDRPMDPQSMDFVDPGPIWLLPVDGAAVPTWPLFISWTIGNTVATITPTSGPLEHDKGYRVMVTAGGFSCRSAAGTPMVDAYEQAEGFRTIAA